VPVKARLLISTFGMLPPVGALRYQAWLVNRSRVPQLKLTGPVGQVTYSAHPEQGFPFAKRSTAIGQPGSEVAHAESSFVDHRPGQLSHVLPGCAGAAPAGAAGTALPQALPMALPRGDLELTLDMR